MPLALMVLALFLPGNAQGSHSLNTCNQTWTAAGTSDLADRLHGTGAYAGSPVPDHTTVCLQAGNYTSANSRTTLGSFSSPGTIDPDSIIVRNASGHAVTLRGQLEIHDNADFLHFYGFTIDGSDAINAGSTEGHGVVYLNGDNETFERMAVTSAYAGEDDGANAGQSCFHSATSPRTGEVGTGYISTDVTIKNSRIYDCGANEQHHHCVYFGTARGWEVANNWIYECSARVIQLNSDARDNDVHHNVLAQGCTFEKVHTTLSCSANVLYLNGGGSTSVEDNTVHDNTVAYPFCDTTSDGCVNSMGNPVIRYNVSDPGPVGTGNEFTSNCLWSDNTGDRALNDLSTAPADVFQSGNVTANPNFSTDTFVGYTSVVHVWRSFDIPTTSSCNGKEPTGTVGPPG
jgi:hypothetical protein